MNDDALIAQTLAGRPEAFGELVRTYQDRLYRALAEVVGEEDARDVTQDAFVQAFVKLKTFRGGSRFYTWLYRIAFNRAASCFRRKRPHQPLEVDPAAASADPAGPLEQAESCRQVRTALAALSVEHRQILVLREIEGLDYNEIAELLDVPLGTVRSRLYRARLELREELKSVGA